MAPKLDRREFLRCGVITTAALMTTGSVSLLNAGDSYAEQFPDLVVSHGGDPAALTRSAVDALGGMKRFVKPGNKVVIKPNMSFSSGPESGGISLRPVRRIGLDPRWHGVFTTHYCVRVPKTHMRFKGRAF